MNCKHARGLFPAYWDDETTQAERESLEGHFQSCAACRREYEQYARTLEVLGSLPRVEPAADLPERVLQRVRRAESVPDVLPAGRPVWVPLAGSVAAVALVAVTLAGPWLGGRREARETVPAPVAGAITEPVLVQPAAGTVPDAPRALPARADVVALSADSLFDHSEDVEFILDPVTLHRGRASVHRTSGARTDERAVITF